LTAGLVASCDRRSLAVQQILEGTEAGGAGAQLEGLGLGLELGHRVEDNAVLREQHRLRAWVDRAVVE
jgi:hypothetical protein